MMSKRSLVELIQDYEAEHAFARQITMPVEDWARYMPTVKWEGGYRWFRSPNVICLEKYRRLRTQW
jgi:hypothetical protein